MELFRPVCHLTIFRCQVAKDVAYVIRSKTVCKKQIALFPNRNRFRTPSL